MTEGWIVLFFLMRLSWPYNSESYVESSNYIPMLNFVNPTGSPTFNIPSHFSDLVQAVNLAEKLRMKPEERSMV
jgi:hypothetical protein